MYLLRYANDTVKRVIRDLEEYKVFHVSCNELEYRSTTLLENGNRYLGQWSIKFDERAGKGIEVYPDGAVYEGYFFQDKRYRKGRYIDKDGGVYEGEWLDDKYHGKGVYIKADDFTYEGEFKHGYMDGKG